MSSPVPRDGQRHGLSQDENKNLNSIASLKVGNDRLGYSLTIYKFLANVLWIATLAFFMY